VARGALSGRNSGPPTRPGAEVEGTAGRFGHGPAEGAQSPLLGHRRISRRSSPPRLSIRPGWSRPMMGAGPERARGSPGGRPGSLAAFLWMGTWPWSASSGCGAHARRASPAVSPAGHRHPRLGPPVTGARPPRNSAASAWSWPAPAWPWFSSCPARSRDSIPQKRDHLGSGQPLLPVTGPRGWSTGGDWHSWPPQAALVWAPWRLAVLAI
jgi:hypothetical protein